MPVYAPVDCVDFNIPPWCSVRANMGLVGGRDLYACFVFS